LKYLSLCYNAIGEVGARALMNVLGGESTLHSLTLEGNGIGPNGAVSIASSLPKNTCLYELNLKDNGIGQQGVQAICDALACNHSLTTITVKDRTTRRLGSAIDSIGRHLERNKAVVAILKETNLAAGLWPDLIEKLGRQAEPDHLHFLLSQKVDLFRGE